MNCKHCSKPIFYGARTHQHPLDKSANFDMWRHIDTGMVMCSVTQAEPNNEVTIDD